MPSELDYSLLQQGSKYNKRPVKLTAELVRKPKKKQSKVKTSTMKNQLQIVKASKSPVKPQEEHPVFALHGILRNHNRVTSVQNSFEPGNLQESNLAKHHSLKRPAKHVRFSGKDEVIGNSSNQCSSELPLSRKDLPIECEESQEVNGSNEDALLNIVNDRQAESLREKKQWADLHCCFAPPGTGSNNSCHGIGRTSMGVDLNQTLQNSDNLHLVHTSCSDSANNLSHMQNTLSYFPKGAFHEENRTEGNVERPPNTKTRIPDPSAYPSPRSAAMNSVATLTRNSASQPSRRSVTNIFGINEEQSNQLAATRQSYSDCTLHSPRDMIGGNCSSSIELNRINRQSLSESRRFGDPGAISDPLPVFRDKWGDEEFVGLPLNSHGEVIPLHSSGKVGYNYLFKKQPMTIPSVSTLPLYFNLAGNKKETDHSNIREKLPFTTEFPRLRWFPQQNRLKENPVKAPISCKPTSKSEIIAREIHVDDKMRETNHYVQQLDSDMNLVNIYSYGHKEYNLPQNCAGKEITMSDSDYVAQSPQSTMRLMGKNLTVGKSGIECQGLDDGRLWTGKEMKTDNLPPMTASSKFIPRPCFQREWVPCQLSGVSKENMFDSVEGERNPKPASFLRMTASAEPKFAHSHLNCRTHLMSVDGHPMVGGQHGSELSSFRQVLPSHPLLSKASISQIDSVNMVRQAPMCVSDPYKSHLRSMMLKSKQFRHNSSEVYNLPSHFQLPFRNDDSGKHKQPPRAQCPSMDLHPWLQNGAHQKETLYTSHPRDLFGEQSPCMKAHSTVLTHRSPYAIPPISLPAHNTDSSQLLLLQNSSTQASLVHHPSLFPADIPGFRPPSKRNGRFINMSQKSSSTCLKDLNRAKKAKKRQSQSDVSSMPTKKANLEMQKDLSAMSVLNKRVQVPGYTKYNAETTEAHIPNYKSVEAGSPSVEIEKDGSQIASGAKTFRVDGVPRLGPIKLSAGAKHILRPSQNTDQDDGRPTHSTIRFTALADSGKVPGFQEKTAKIYRF